MSSAGSISTCSGAHAELMFAVHLVSRETHSGERDSEREADLLVTAVAFQAQDELKQKHTVPPGGLTKNVSELAHAVQ